MYNTVFYISYFESYPLGLWQQNLTSDFKNTVHFALLFLKNNIFDILDEHCIYIASILISTSNCSHVSPLPLRFIT